MKYKKLIFLLIILLLEGCAKIDNEKTEELINTNDTNIDILQDKISDLEAEKETLATQVNKLETENHELNLMIDDLVLDRKDLIDNSYLYKQDKRQYVLGYKKYIGEEPIRSLPSSDSIEVNSNSPIDVQVICTVINGSGEKWALVEAVKQDFNNYGFVRVEDIVDKEYTGVDYSSLNVPVIIEDIRIGDVYEKAISKFGIDYKMTSGFEKGIIHFGETFFDGIDFHYNIQTHNIWGLIVNSEGYKTTEGYGIGSNAIDTIEYYKSLYPMNGETNFAPKVYEGIKGSVGYWAFDVGSEYILNFKIDTEQLREESIITEIRLMPFLWYYTP